MSVGAWVLLIFGLFALVSFLDALRAARRTGSGFLSGASRPRCSRSSARSSALFLAGYTGVLLSVSNQPIWSDTWALGGLFLASGLSVAAAALGAAGPSGAATSRAPRPSSPGPTATSSLLELVLLVVFFVSARRDRRAVPGAALARAVGARAGRHPRAAGAPLPPRAAVTPAVLGLVPGAARRAGPAHRRDLRSADVGAPASALAALHAEDRRAPSRAGSMTPATTWPTPGPWTPRASIRCGSTTTATSLAAAGGHRHRHRPQPSGRPAHGCRRRGGRRAGSADDDAGAASRVAVPCSHRPGGQGGTASRR